MEGLPAKKIKIAFLIRVKRVEALDQELFPLDVVALWEPVSMATNYYKMAILFPSNYCNLFINQLFSRPRGNEYRNGVFISLMDSGSDSCEEVASSSTTKSCRKKLPRLK